MNLHISHMRSACLCCDNSSCEVKTGAVAVRDGKEIIEGWNEKLSDYGKTNSPERDEVIHAEAALISRAAAEGVSIKGCTLYLTRFPCESCARMIYKAGVSEIYYMSDLFTSGNTAKTLLNTLGIKVSQIEEAVVWE